MLATQENTQIIQKLYEAFGRGDMPAVLSCMDEQATLINKFGKGHFWWRLTR